jgi:hypothetical protein
MGETELGRAETAALAALANGILPADARDAGAAAVAAGPRLAEQSAAGGNAALYRSGVAAAAELARQRFGRGLAELSAGQMQDLIGALRERQPAFFRQLRADVCALYLSDPAVWARIGFPGPSTAQGGYPDFDQRQADSRRPH